VHVIYTKSENEVMNYLKGFEGDIIVASEGSDIVGGLLIARKKYGHVVASFKHIAAKNADKEIIKSLVKKAEELSNAAKIELHIAEGEKIPYKFFKKLGYKVEGKLRSHYRADEKCYILGKVV